jgi:hypothetical protein
MSAAEERHATLHRRQPNQPGASPVIDPVDFRGPQVHPPAAGGPGYRRRLSWFPGVRVAICCEFFRSLGLGLSRTSISVGY